MSISEITDIKLLQKKSSLQLCFENGEGFTPSCSYMRVFSPAEKTVEQKNYLKDLVQQQKTVNIVGIDRIGNYAVKLIFDDGHSSGIYSWETLYDLGKNYSSNWRQNFLETQTNKNHD